MRTLYRSIPQALVFFLIALLQPFSAQAWIEHHLITRAALKAEPTFKDRKVIFTPFEKMAKDLGFVSAQALNESIQIRKSYRFESQLNEKAGKPLPVIDVISHYSDEPDWGMDQELFGPGEYPELWRDEYAFMGGRDGLSSQAHRHMYWPEFQWANPLRTFKVPPAKMFKVWGLAPERAKVFADLSNRAAQAGHSYWAARFMAHALHYLEDVTQPFHATQLPSKKFVIMPFTETNGAGTQDYVKQVEKLVTYYHLAFEDYVGYLMKESAAGRLSQPEVTELFRKLEQSQPGAEPLPTEIPQQVVRMAQMAVNECSESGNISIRFFPEIPGSLLNYDIFGFLNGPDFNSRVAERIQDQPAVREEYFRVIGRMFEVLGPAIRHLAAPKPLKD